MPRQGKGLSYRAKKAKALPVAESRLDENLGGSSEMTAGEPSVAALTEQEEHTAVGPPELPGKRLRDEAAEATAEAFDEVNAAEVSLRKAEAVMARALRLSEERGRRWEAAERRDPPPSAYLQLERPYKSLLATADARLELEKARRLMAEAESEQNCCFWLEEQLENARLKRDLRWYTRKSSVRSSAGSGKRVKA